MARPREDVSKLARSMGISHLGRLLILKPEIEASPNSWCKVLLEARAWTWVACPVSLHEEVPGNQLILMNLVMTYSAFIYARLYYYKYVLMCGLGVSAFVSTFWVDFSIYFVALPPPNSPLDHYTRFYLGR
jgi:hypothetical protein